MLVLGTLQVYAWEADGYTLTLYTGQAQVSPTLARDGAILVSYIDDELWRAYVNADQAYDDKKAREKSKKIGF